MSHHSEGVELTTGQVEKGAAALRGFTGGVNACHCRRFYCVVLGRVAPVPLDGHAVAAAVLLHRGVLRFARS